MDELKNETMVTAGNADAGGAMSAQQELAHCPVCGEATEALLPSGIGQRFPNLAARTCYKKCACERAKDEAEQALRVKHEHEEKVRRLRERCFSGNLAMKKLTFAESTQENSAIDVCRKFAKEWDNAKADNLGMLFWGDVGTGKRYMAASIANALLEQEVSVRMVNLSDVMNATFESRGELLREVRQCALLIIDDYGMERDTEYGNEIAFQVIDARYQSRKPLIVTTNLSLNTLNSPKDTNHKRIYDRILEMCSPVHFEEANLRTNIRKQKMDCLREILGIKKEGKE